MRRPAARAAKWDRVDAEKGPVLGGRRKRYILINTKSNIVARDRLGCVIAKTTAEIGATDLMIGTETREIFGKLARKRMRTIEAA